MATKKPHKEPGFVTPMAAQLVRRLPVGADWLYEIKWDGYRALLIKNGKLVELRSRNDKDLTRMYPAIATAAEGLKPEALVLDGEVVALALDGRPSFQALQHRGSHANHQVVYYAFDVLHWNGRDLMLEPLDKRRARLCEILVPTDVLRVSQDLPADAKAVVSALRAAGIEGVIAKRKGSAYQPGERSNDWQKLKLERQQEFVVGGYRPDGAIGLDALLVGYYEAKELRFAGKVRAGLIPHVRRDVLGKLKPLRITNCPFSNLPDASSGRWGGGITADDMSEMQWTKPQLVAQIRFVEWTAENRLRHAAFLGLRIDKSAGDVRRER
ncbi:MAG: non-homologous end-joining DNA ligase [Gammaproteobacteria bacterium]|nr:non-homologous end-joining DNA ligase [Gammaproteobacteria bacterium]